MPFEDGSDRCCSCDFSARNEETLTEHASRCRPNRRRLLYEPDGTYHTREDFVKHRIETIRRYTGGVKGRGILEIGSPATFDEGPVPKRCHLEYALHECKTDSESDKDPSSLSSDTESDRIFPDEMSDVDEAASSCVGSTSVKSHELLLCVASDLRRMQYVKKNALLTYRAMLTKLEDVKLSMASCSFSDPKEPVRPPEGSDPSESERIEPLSLQEASDSGDIERIESMRPQEDFDSGDYKHDDLMRLQEDSNSGHIKHVESMLHQESSDTGDNGLNEPVHLRECSDPGDSEHDELMRPRKRSIRCENEHNEPICFQEGSFRGDNEPMCLQDGSNTVDNEHEEPTCLQEDSDSGHIKHIETMNLQEGSDPGDIKFIEQIRPQKGSDNEESERNIIILPRKSSNLCKNERNDTIRFQEGSYRGDNEQKESVGPQADYDRHGNEHEADFGTGQTSSPSVFDSDLEMNISYPLHSSPEPRTSKKQLSSFFIYDDEGKKLSKFLRMVLSPFRNRRIIEWDDSDDSSDLED